jgi:hypothetical protein
MLCLTAACSRQQCQGDEAGGNWKPHGGLQAWCTLEPPSCELGGTLKPRPVLQQIRAALCSPARSSGPDRLEQCCCRQDRRCLGAVAGKKAAAGQQGMPWRAALPCCRSC